MLAAGIIAAFLLGACGEDEQSGFTLVQPPPHKEACAFEPPPTPQLDAIKQRLEAAGYRVDYSAYSAAGYFGDIENETDEVCADSALTVGGMRLGRFSDVTIREYSDPATLERTAADLGGQKDTVLVQREPLVYFYTAGDRGKLDRVIAIAER